MLNDDQVELRVKYDILNNTATAQLPKQKQRNIITLTHSFTSFYIQDTIIPLYPYIANSFCCDIKV